MKATRSARHTPTRSASPRDPQPARAPAAPLPPCSPRGSQRLRGDLPDSSGSATASDQRRREQPLRGAARYSALLSALLLGLSACAKLISPGPEDSAAERGATGSDATATDSPASDTAQSDSAESDAARSDSTDADSADPNAADPNAADPNAADPNAADPNAADPNAADPNAAESDSSDPDSSEPDSAEPAADPDSTEPDATNPDSADPDPTEPDSTGPGAGVGSDAIGEATATSVSCDDNAACCGTDVSCYALSVECPGIATTRALVKLTQPSESVGTVVFTTGGYGDALYDSGLEFSNLVVSELYDAGYASAQIQWTDTGGWLQGPGGPRKLACRPSTAMRWIYENHHTGGQDTGFCAAGGSGGAGQIAYALAHYGLHDVLDFVAVNGGPPMARPDLGCLCDDPTPLAIPACGINRTVCFDERVASVFDTMFDDDTCSSATEADRGALLEAGVLAPDATLNYPTTKAMVLFGAIDDTIGLSHGQLWGDAVTSELSFTCIPNTPHEFENTTEGARATFDALAENCRPQLRR